MKKLFLSLPFLIVIIGCGNTTQQKKRMQIGESYVVYAGDKIEKLSEDARVQITHFEGSKTSSVSLLKGSANIEYTKNK